MNILYLFHAPPVKNDFSRFGLKAFDDAGHTIQCLELGNLILPKLQSNRNDYVDFPVSIVAPEKKDCMPSLEKFVAQADYVVAVIQSRGLTKGNLRVFQLLARHKAKVILLSFTRLPTAEKPDARWYMKFREIYKRVAHFDIRNSILARMPAAILKCCEADYVVCEGRLNKSQNNLISESTYQFSVIGNDIASIIPFLSKGARRDHIVYVDQCQDQHPDFIEMNGSNCIKTEPFENNLNRVFNALEAQIKLPVVIAAHPRRKRSQSVKDTFADRPLIFDKTMALIAESALVITHTSTCFFACIALRKPMLIVADRQHYNGFRSARLHLHGFASKLRQPLIFSDDPDLDEKLRALDFTADEDLYASIEEEYIPPLRRESGVTSTWDHVVAELNRAYQKDTPHMTGKHLSENGVNYEC